MIQPNKQFDKVKSRIFCSRCIQVARVNIRQQMKNEANEMWELNRCPY